MMAMGGMSLLAMGWFAANEADDEELRLAAEQEAIDDAAPYIDPDVNRMNPLKPNGGREFRHKGVGLNVDKNPFK